MEVLDSFVPSKLKKRLTPNDIKEISDKTELKNALIADSNSPYSKRPYLRKDWKLKMSKDFDTQAFNIGVSAVELNQEEMDQNVIKGIERQLRKEPEAWENVRQEMYETYKFAETATKIV